MPRRRLATLAAAALSVAFAAPAEAAETVAREVQSFTADVHQGHVAWSAYDHEARAFRLRVRVPDGRILTPAIAPRGLAFDVGLGTGPNGLAAAYSRCRVEGRPPFFGEFGVPQDPGAPQSGCDLYRFDFRTGQEVRLDALSSAGRDEINPSIRGSRVAFVRRFATKDVVYTGDATSGRVLRQPAPTRGVTRRAATFVELGQELAVVYVTDRTGFSESVLWRIRNGRARQVWDTRSGGANASAIISPGFFGRHLYFAETNNGSGAGNRIYRYTMTSGRIASARGSSRYTSVGRLNSGGFAEARGSEGCAARLDAPPSASGCTLVLSDPVPFRGL